MQTVDNEHRTKVAMAGTKVQKHSWVVPADCLGTGVGIYKMVLGFGPPVPPNGR